MAVIRNCVVVKFRVRHILRGLFIQVESDKHFAVLFREAPQNPNRQCVMIPFDRFTFRIEARVEEFVFDVEINAFPAYLHGAVYENRPPAGGLREGIEKQ